MPHQLSPFGTIVAPAAGAPLTQILIGTVIAGTMTIGVLIIGWLHRTGRTQLLTTVGKLIGNVQGLPPWASLPLAMIVLSITLVPFFHNARVYTAYEYLERRFDMKTRAFTSLLFLLSRSMSLGVVISAPAVVFSVVLGTDLTTTALLIGVPTIVYTMFGGVQAVTWTDVKQMVLIVAGLVAAVVVLIRGLPDEVGVGQALRIAGAAGRLRFDDLGLLLGERLFGGQIANDRNDRVHRALAQRDSEHQQHLGAQDSPR